MDQREADTVDGSSRTALSHLLSRDSESSDSTLRPGYYCEKLGQKAKHRTTSLWQHRAIRIALITLFAAFGIGSAIRVMLFLSPPTLTSMGPCGQTQEQARQNGCKYDIMMGLWVHPPCYDQELSDQFLREGNFTFTRDREGTQQVDEAEVRLGNFEMVFAEPNFHYKHCAYLWAKQIRARRKSPFILDSKARSVEHIEHCIQLVGNPNTSVSEYLGPGADPSELDCLIGEGEIHTAH